VFGKIYENTSSDDEWNRSGQLNAKQRELLELQALAQRRLKGVRSNFSEGLKAAKETKRDLEWTQKRVR
jgi:hypothetical protein